MKHTTTVILSAILSLPAAAAADDSAKPWYESGRITGELLGIRTAAEAAGVSPFASYTAMYAANTSGGLARTDDFASDMYFGLRFDLGKMFGIPGVIFRVSGIDRHGHTIAPDVGSEFDPMQLYGGQTAFLYELNLEKLFENGLSLKLGRMGASDDFIRSPLLTYATNNTLAGIRAVLLDDVMTAYPDATWGARLKYQPSEGHALQLGVYQLFEGMWNSENHGTNMRLSRHDGMSCMLQYDLDTEISGRRAHFFAGMNSVDYSMTEHGTGRITHHLLRLYGHGEIEFDNGLALFTSLAYSPHFRLARMRAQVSIGANWRGLIPARPWDRTFLHITYGGLGDTRPPGAGGRRPDYEMVFEAGHRIQPVPSIHLQPVIQYIHRPGGTGRIADALVLGIQAGVLIF